ncbi:Endonuclease/exonuclease/phosphatase [Senna tora]|uniref:Endonuclease/exonuclease/phosphatase n=1 Tax=Senna tora TaxID=362788 RepID=A0A834T4Z8_9FABA|nr:Endonuclease/exonuclease/phosphatase [Senna tora]
MRGVSSLIHTVFIHPSMRRKRHRESVYTLIIPKAKKQKTQMAQNYREIGWIDSSDSEISDAEEVRNPENPITRPLQNPDQLELLLFPLCKTTLMQIGIKVVGGHHNRFVIHFEVMADMQQILNEGPWSVQGSLLIVFPWERNAALRQIVVSEVSVWVQLWDVPLEYQTPLVAHQIGSLIGVVREKMGNNSRFNVAMREFSVYAVDVAVLVIFRKSVIGPRSKLSLFCPGSKSIPQYSSSENHFCSSPVDSYGYVTNCPLLINLMFLKTSLVTIPPKNLNEEDLNALTEQSFSTTYNSENFTIDGGSEE